MFSSSTVFAIEGKSYLPEPASFSSLECVCEGFEEQYKSLLWFTYRSGFPEIQPSAKTSDAGWGCMLRSGQMMTAHALRLHFFGHGWRLPKQLTAFPPSYFEIIRYFADQPQAPFSIHKFAQLGCNYQKNIGDWFGPNTTAQVLEVLVKSQRVDSGQFKLYQAQDGVIYLDEINHLCANPNSPPLSPFPSSSSTSSVSSTTTATTTWNGSLFILVPLRLGLDQLNPVYVDVVKESFRFPQSIGIIGGKPHSAYYFIALQDDSLYYLDPHTVQPTIETNESSFDSQSYHCSVVKKIGISGLDPSLAFGFFCKTESEFQDFVSRVEQLSSTLGGGSMVPFSILKKRPDYDDSRDIFGEHEVDALTSIGDEDFVSDLVII